VTRDRVLWSWGEGYYGQLWLGDIKPRQRWPERLGKEMFMGSPGLMVACGLSHMLVLTNVGHVWSCDEGEKHLIESERFRDR